MTKQAVIDGQLINYLLYPGNAERPVLVFLHGWRSEAAVWYHIVQMLKEQADVGDIYCLDLPGFGASPMVKKSMTLADYSASIEGFVKKLKLEKVILIGHSFGGRVAIKLAGAKADWLKKIVLVDSAGLIHNKNRKKLYAFLAKLAKPIFWPKFMKPLRAKIYWKLGAQDYVATPRLNETFVGVIAEDLADILSAINVPTLIIWGNQDIETPLSDAKHMAKKIKGSELKIIHGAGHLSFLDKPEKFVRDIKDFVK